MSSLIGQGINGTIDNLLQVDGGVDGTLKPVEDGFGVSTPLEISTDEVNINGTFSVNGGILDGNLSTDGTQYKFLGANLTNPIIAPPGEIQFNDAVNFNGGPVTLVTTYPDNQLVQSKIFTQCTYRGMRAQDAFNNFTFNVNNLSTTYSDVAEITFTSGMENSGMPTISARADIASVDQSDVPLQVAPKGAEYLHLGTSSSLGVLLTAEQPLVDDNENELVKFVSTASAVNEVTITNASTGTAPSIEGTGTDTNVNITIKGQGTGIPVLGKTSDIGVQLAANQALLDNSNNELISFTKTAVAVNQVNVTNAATTGSPVISAVGSDANIGLIVQTKGIGALIFKSANTTTPLSISSGTTYQHTTNIVIPDTAQTRTITLPDADRNLSEVSVRAYVSGVASVSSTPIKIPFATEQFDVGSYFDSVTNYRFTPLIAGTYRVSAQYAATLAFQGTFIIAIFKNGSLYSNNNTLTPFTSSQTITPSISDLVQMNGTTDYIEVYAYSSSATLVTMLTGAVNSFITVSKV